jgi:hypothetical protein
LAEQSGTSAETIKNFETRGSDPKRSTMLKWRTALSQAGVEFLEDGAKADEGGPGVRLRAKKR